MRTRIFSLLFHRHLALFLSGALTVVAFAPFHLWWVALFSMGALMRLASGSESFAEALKRGVAFGLGLFLAGVHWIYVSVGVHGDGGLLGGVVATLIFVVYLTLYPAAVTSLAFILAPHSSRHQKTFIALLWVIMEWLRGVLFPAFAWLILGHAMIDSPLAAWGTLGGGLLLSLFALISVRALFWLVELKRWGRCGAALLLLLIWGGGALLNPLYWSDPDEKSVRVALVQGNFTQDLKWQPEMREVTIERYLQMSEPLWGEYDLIVWPETAVPDFLHTVMDSLIEPLIVRSKEEGSTLILGVPLFDFLTHAYYNSLLILGETPHLYSKRHLVPFGEYLPLRSWFGEHLNALGLPSEDFSTGPFEKSVAESGHHRVGLSICFEMVQTYLIRKDVQLASYLVNVSNDAWFGHSLAPHQHLQIARMRALESNRPIVRSTNTGVSALIGADGKVIAQGAQFQPLVVTGEITPRHGLTPFVRWGEAPWVGALLLAVASLFYRVRTCSHKRVES